MHAVFELHFKDRTEFLNHFSIAIELCSSENSQLAESHAASAALKASPGGKKVPAHGAAEAVITAQSITSDMKIELQNLRKIDEKKVNTIIDSEVLALGPP